jgi:DNA-binding FadR family transcriptional regulator
LGTSAGTVTGLELPGPCAPADFSERSELALDSRKKRKNYPNPLTVSGGHEEASDDEAWRKATQDFHSTVCRMSGNPLLNLLAPSLKNIYAERVGGDVIPRSERPALIDVHGRIAEAISHGDMDTAQRLMHDHMQELAAREPSNAIPV